MSIREYTIYPTIRLNGLIENFMYFEIGISMIMPKMSVGFAMILLVAGNMIAVLSDALIKELPDGAAVY